VTVLESFQLYIKLRTAYRQLARALGRDFQGFKTWAATDRPRPAAGHGRDQAGGVTVVHDGRFQKLFGLLLRRHQRHGFDIAAGLTAILKNHKVLLPRVAVAEARPLLDHRPWTPHSQHQRQKDHSHDRTFPAAIDQQPARPPIGRAP